jgi:uncharacterized phage protein (TIGR02218 family)
MTLPCLSQFSQYISQNNYFVFGDLYTFQLQTGEQLRYSGGSQSLTIPGTAWANNSGSLNALTGQSWIFSLGPSFGRSKVSREVGVKPTELELTIMATGDDLIGNELTWQQAANLGLFDYCVVELDRYLAGPGGWNDTSNGAVVWFYGQVGDITVGRTAIKMKVLALIATMNQQQMPRRIFSSNCTHVFGDAMCQFDRSTMGVTIAAVGPSTDQFNIDTGITPNPINLYVDGTLVCISGLNTGYQRKIQGWADGTIAAQVQPWIYPVQIGDKFTLLPGCDHTVNTCQSLFNNLIHYGGMPYIPPPELAV